MPIRASSYRAQLASECSPPASLRLREVFETWTSSELPGEVEELARALMHAEGIKEPAVGWDNYEGPPSMPPLEECLLWPEGVPALLKSKSK